MMIDRDDLRATGAQTYRFKGDALVRAAARSGDEDRPWSPKPAVRPRAAPAEEPEPEENVAAQSRWDGLE